MYSKILFHFIYQINIYYLFNQTSLALGKGILINNYLKFFILTYIFIISNMSEYFIIELKLYS